MEEVCAIRNFQLAVGIEQDLFNPILLKKRFGDSVVDIVNQNPTCHMMTLKSKELLQYKQQKKLSEFVEYQMKYDMQTSAEKGEKNVDFCVNVDIGLWTTHMKALKEKVPKELMCMSEFDMLSFARIKILGVTDPQVYLKVKGNWTGGHQENLRVRATNINHGPHSSLWYNVGGQQNIDRFRQLAQADFKIDIFKSEGQWFCDPDYCIANGIPIKIINQKAGDMIVLQPGTVHWVRSLGLTT